MVAKGWCIELIGEPKMLQSLKDSLPPDFVPHIDIFSDTSGDKYFLHDPVFDQLADVNKVRAKGVLLARDLLGAWSIKNRKTASVVTGIVCYFDGQGRPEQRYVMAIASADCSSSVISHVIAVGSDGRRLPAAPPQPSPVQNLYALAQDNEAVRVLLRSAGQADDWYEVFKIYESAWEIAKLLGHAPLNNYLGDQADQIDFMRWSSHNERHIKVHEPCPAGFGPQPMPFQEAKTLALWLADHMLGVVVASCDDNQNFRIFSS